MAGSRSVLITGASSGIGRACALHFQNKGWTVYAGVRRPEDAQSLAAQPSGRLVPVILDVTRQETIEAARALIAERAAPLHGLINNAGIAVSGPLETIPLDEVEALLRVNVLGTFAVTRTFLPQLRQAQGRIVNISSISGLFAPPGLTAYAASKFALEGLTDGLRVELAPFNVKVISVAPGKIDTPIWDKAREASTRIEARQTEDVRALYRPLMRFYEHYAERERATPMDEVTRAVEHAMCATAPRARYVVGRAARIRVWVALLPTGLRDAVVRRAIKRGGA